MGNLTASFWLLEESLGQAAQWEQLFHFLRSSVWVTDGHIAKGNGYPSHSNRNSWIDSAKNYQ